MTRIQKFTTKSLLATFGSLFFISSAIAQWTGYSGEGIPGPNLPDVNVSPTPGPGGDSGYYGGGGPGPDGNGSGGQSSGGNYSGGSNGGGNNEETSVVPDWLIDLMKEKLLNMFSEKVGGEDMSQAGSYCRMKGLDPMFYGPYYF